MGEAAGEFNNIIRREESMATSFSSMGRGVARGAGGELLDYSPGVDMRYSYRP